MKPPLLPAKSAADSCRSSPPRPPDAAANEVPTGIVTIRHTVSPSTEPASEDSRRAVQVGARQGRPLLAQQRSGIVIRLRAALDLDLPDALERPSRLGGGVGEPLPRGGPV